MFNFERLAVWKKAVEYAGLIYSATRAFPTQEQFGLTSQIRRAANSISSNIAEGSARTPADFDRFVGYATGSLFETLTQAMIARNEGLLPQNSFDALYEAAEEISRMLSGLRKSLAG
jgi:four helix bundle protein